jgi:hypothetical protein
MTKLSIFIFSVIFIMSFSLQETSAQEIQADITVHSDRLDFQYRTNVSSMQRDLENYINNQRFTDIDWEGDKIPVDIQIYLTGGANNRYTAKLVIMSARFLDGPGDGQSPSMKIYDDKWAFEYGLGANLTYNDRRYDAFVTLIDYYMLMIIGVDMDTYGEADGDPAFNQALNLLYLAAGQNGIGFDTYSEMGKFSRYNLLKEFTDMRFTAFRKLIFAYYVDGLDVMGFDKEKAMKAMKETLKSMAEFKKDKLSGPSILMQFFFDTKAREIANIFNGDDDAELWGYLKYMDPSNSMLYDEARDGKLGSEY